MSREITKHVFDWKTDKLIRTEMAVPECGKDFCDSCGDCLHCYWHDPCPRRDEHFWVVYEEDPNE